MKGLSKMYYQYRFPYYVNMPMYNYGVQCGYWTDHANNFGSFHSSHGKGSIVLKDYGPKPFVVNINQAMKQNNTYW
jgi:hypothetical protein